MRYVSLFLLLLVFSAPSYAQDIDDSDLVIQNAYDILKQIDEESADDLPPPVKKSTPTTTKAPVRTITAEKIPPFSGPKEYSLSFENPDSWNFDSRTAYMASQDRLLDIQVSRQTEDEPDEDDDGAATFKLWSTK